jgi:hypothetical protein
MAAIARVISSMLAMPSRAACCASLAKALACMALLAVEWIMLDISSKDALVSCTDAACSLAPSASCWLACATWFAAIKL